MTQSPEVRDINARLTGFTIVRELELTGDMKSGDYTLRVCLASEESPSSPTVTLLLQGVSGLSLCEVGGGITYFPCLAVRDVSMEQHDRIRFEVVDLEENRIFVRALSVEIR